VAVDDIVSGVAGRYASALFDLADSAGEADKVMGELDTFAAAVDQSADFARLVRSPVFSADDQVKALEAILPTLGISGLAANLLKLMARNRRLYVARDVVTGYRRLLADKRGAATAEVTSAEPLSDAQTTALKAALTAKTGKTIEIDAKVDPSLIGGLIVKLGSRMIDSSLKTKLSQLKIALKEVH
jgi:F-type H+-transporting ATPase subunit delta